jgi:hypothetical protein
MLVSPKKKASCNNKKIPSKQIKPSRTDHGTLQFYSPVSRNLSEVYRKITSFWKKKDVMEEIWGNKKVNNVEYRILKSHHNLSSKSITKQYLTRSINSSTSLDNKISESLLSTDATFSKDMKNAPILEDITNPIESESVIAYRIVRSPKKASTSSHFFFCCS